MNINLSLACFRIGRKTNEQTHVHESNIPKYYRGLSAIKGTGSKT